MKPFLTLLLLLLGSHISIAQELPVDATNGLINFSQVLPLEGVSQAQLYARGKVWFATAFKSANSVVQADDQATGVLVGKAWAPISIHYIGANRPASQLRLWYTVKLGFKEGRYRYEITDMQMEWPNSSNPNQPLENLAFKVSGAPAKQMAIIAEYQQETNRVASGLESSIKTSMAKPAAGTVAGKTDW